MVGENRNTLRIISPDEVANKLRYDYAHCESDLECKRLDAIVRVLRGLQKQPFRLDEFLNETAQFIYRQLNIQSLSISVKDVDGKFRYHAFAGLRKASEEALKKCVYSEHELFDPSKYPHTTISVYTKLFLAENNPYAPGEEETYNRPLMLQQTRKEIDDSIEGDYLDILIFDSKNEVCGYIEISGTKDGKLPDAKTIKWLEVTGSIIGFGIQMDRMERASRRHIIMPDKDV
jgi:hypothetical protein